jgi:putative thioredoxin
MGTFVNDVSTPDFASAVVERSRQVPVVVDFWAAWCGPCRVLGPMLERLAEEGAGSWELAKIDVDANQELAARFGVQGIPTVVAFRDGSPVAQFTGALPEAQVRRFIDDLVPSELDIAVEQGALLLEDGDTAGAEAAWRAALASDPSHAEAGTYLASLLVDRNEPTEALAILDRLATTPEVGRLRAVAHIQQGDGDLETLAAAAADPDDHGAGLAYGRALGAAGRNAEALERLVEVVAARAGAPSEEARAAMLDLFELLGDHPLVGEYRRRLASALF